MRSPLGSILTKAFLFHFEKECLHTYSAEFKSKLHKWYVNDIFVMFQFRDYAKRFVDYMNTKHPNILFTFEIEDQNSSLLDTKIIMRNTEIKAFETSV